MRRWEEWEPTRDEAEFDREMRGHDGKLAMLFVVGLCALVVFLMVVAK